MFKFWLGLAFCIFLSVWFIKWANSEGMLVEHSMAYEKNQTPQGNLSELFGSMGLSHSLNPRIDAEENAARYCTQHGLNLLLSEQSLHSEEEKLIRQFMLSTDMCGNASAYIGRVCKQENFKKIYKHFTLKK